MLHRSSWHGQTHTWTGEKQQCRLQRDCGRGPQQQALHSFNSFCLDHAHEAALSYCMRMAADWKVLLLQSSDISYDSASYMPSPCMSPQAV